MGNDHALEIVGVGTIKLKMYDGIVRTIQGVLHVKGLKKNQLFVGKLDDLECKIHIEGEILMGSFMYVMICTKPNIAQAMRAISRFMVDLGKEHWSVVKRILRYIKGTSGVALCFEGSKFIVMGYVNSDFVGDLDQRKSTTGYVFTLAEGVVSWWSKLQTVIALSTIEAKYMAITEACKEAIWIQS